MELNIQKNTPINVLSLFDGISGAKLALNRTGININKYYASEIDKYATEISQRHHKDVVRLGDIRNWRAWYLKNIDLIIGGSPCTNLSRAGDGSGLNGEESALLYDFVDILQHYQPKYFLLENVKMRQDWVDVITELLGVSPILIDSALISAQHRERYYWTNIPNVTLPENRHIFMKSIVLSDVIPVAIHNLYGGFKEKTVRVFKGKSPTVRTAKGGGHIPSFVRKSILRSQETIEYIKNNFNNDQELLQYFYYSNVDDIKLVEVVAKFFEDISYRTFKNWNIIRKFHPIECERLQTLPDHYTEGVSNTQRYRAIGNGFTIDVISHILSFLPKIHEKGKEAT